MTPARDQPGEPRALGWPAVLLALLASHLTGDFLLQTEWQAVNKGGGLSDSRSRGALLAHVGVYTAAFSPALTWIARRTGVWRAAMAGTAIAVPHLLVDDGRLVQGWLREVKRAVDPAPALTVAVDQSLHFLCLLGAALLTVA